MAIDFIAVKRDQSAATEAEELIQYVRQLRTAYETGQRIRAKMRHNFDGGASPIVWTAVETLWGLPAGKGVTVFTFVDGSVGAMEGSFQTSAAKDLTETVG